MPAPEWLLLLRHAKSSWQHPERDDHDRPLNGRGREAARRLGQVLQSRGLEPDHALVSSSLRTCETWALLSEAFAEPPAPHYLEQLYGAPPGAMLELARQAPEGVSCLLLLGHNPGTSALARYLADGGGAAHRRDGRFLKFPTAAAAVFRVTAPDWSGTGPDTVRLESFLDPRNLK